MVELHVRLEAAEPDDAGLAGAGGGARAVSNTAEILGFADVEKLRFSGIHAWMTPMIRRRTLRFPGNLPLATRSCKAAHRFFGRLSMIVAGRAFAQTRPNLTGRTVLQVVPRLDAGGAERTTLDVAAALVQAGARALVACDGGRMVSELQAQGGVWLPFPAATKNPLAMALNVRKLARVIVEERVDVVHARSRAPAWVALGASRIVSRPLVTTYHGAYSGGSALKLRYNSVMARGDVVIANSHSPPTRSRSSTRSRAKRLRVIHRGTDLRAFSPERGRSGSG